MSSATKDVQDVYTETGSLLDKYASLKRYHDNIVSSGLVDRITMESLQAIDPEAILEDYPVESYTQKPTALNREASLEGIKETLVKTFDRLKALLVVLIKRILEFWTKSDVAGKHDQLRRLSITLKDTWEKAEKDWFANGGKGGRGELFDSVNFNDLPPLSSNNEKILLSTFEEKSPVLISLAKLAHMVNNESTSFNARMRLLIRADIALTTSTSIREMTALISELENSDRTINKKYIGYVNDVNEQLFALGIKTPADMNSFFKSAEHSSDFHALAMNWMKDGFKLDRLESLFPSNLRQYERNMRDLGILMDELNKRISDPNLKNIRDQRVLSDLESYGSKDEFKNTTSKLDTQMLKLYDRIREESVSQMIHYQYVMVYTNAYNIMVRSIAQKQLRQIVDHVSSLKHQS